MFLKTIYVLLVAFNGLDSTLALCTGKSFGTNCQYNQFKCRCNANNPCDDNTGECSSGCDPRWMGPACQYGNLAYSKNVFGSFLSKEQMTDGNKETCASVNPTLQSIHRASIDLGSEFIVERLLIYNKDYASNPLSNFNVYVSLGETNVDASSRCYTHPGSVSKEVIDLKCTSALTGRYIQIVLGTGIDSRVCEVEIYGGLNAAYKKEATQIQTQHIFYPSLAVDGNIDNFSHTMSGRWQPWWRVNLGRTVHIERIRIDNRKDCCWDRLNGFRLELYYGSTNIFEHALVVTSQTSLVIDIPLAPTKYADIVRLQLYGKSGILNIAEVEVYFNCPDRLFGIDCQHACNCNDTTEVCDKIYGECSSGCKDGYIGLNCLTACQSGLFGPKCIHSCNCEVPTEVCRYTDGHCSSGCKKGFTGYGCLEDCPDGTFGFNCQNKCNCLSNTEVCNKSNGSCVSGCQNGYTGDGCLTECQPGLFGPKCIHECNCENKTEVCRHTDGTCDNGCKTGYKGVGCLEVCTDGYYGLNCLEECRSCRSKDCNHVTGRCNDGCIPGYRGNWCTEKCLTGAYGVNCSEACVNCNNTDCNHVTGLCNSGCKVGYTGEMCSEKMKATETDSGTGVIIGAVVGAIVAIIIIVVVVIFVLLRRRKAKKNKQGTPTPHTNEVFYENALELGENNENSSKSSVKKNNKGSRKKQPIEAIDATIYDQPDEDSVKDQSLDSPKSETTGHTEQTYYNADTPERSNNSVQVDDLWNYVSKTNQDTFSEEFEKLPSGMVKPYEAAKANMGKNRYRGIYAYDHSRVKLSPPNTDGCDYMNANFIEGYGRSRGFIASQGTTEQNIDDFWLMIWQQKCSTIVMLTNLVEEGRAKCLVYWPEKEETKSFGAIEVTLQKEEVFCNFTIRVLKANKDNQSRIIHQYHFTAWPDKGVPAYPSSLVQFHKKIKSCTKGKTQPVVVHCSAGIGRTGTYIALDYLVDQAKDSDALGVFECVQNLREQRTNMIQTLDQYIFLHTSLVEALHCKGHSMPTEEFRRLYEDINGKRGSRVLEDDFKKLEAVYLGYDVKFTAGEKHENILKNRDQSILPADSERPILSTDIQGCGDYINAVFLPGLRKRRQFIVTQTPLENTVIDFWRMVYEQNTKVIVDLSSDPENYQIYPNNSDLNIGPFTVTSTSKKHDEKTDSIVHSLTVEYQEVHTVMMYKPQFWEMKRHTPPSIPVMMNFIYEINKSGQYGHNGGIVVTCPDGSTRCGLFCVAFVSLDRLRVEQEIGTGQIIKQYRSIRPQIIPNKEQLKYCYDMLMYHLNENETYSNFA